MTEDKVKHIAAHVETSDWILNHGIRDWEICNPGSGFGIRLTNWSLFWDPELTYFMHRAPTKGISELWRVTMTVKMQISGNSTK